MRVVRTTASAPPRRLTPARAVAGPRQRVHDLVRLIRPGQWAKNLFVVPLTLLAVPAPGLAALGRLGVAVAAFTVASSLVYVCNDIADRGRDRLHPVKQHRPVAAGRVSVAAAVGCAAVLAALLAAVILTVGTVSWWPVLAYLMLNVAYSRRLKHVPLIDVFIVATGFLLRAVQGAVALRAPLSFWLLGAVFTLCLFLIVGKRRNEMTNGGSAHRPALAAYTAQYLDHLMLLCATVAMFTFLMFLDAARFAAPYTDVAVLLSLVFAMFALARYLQVVMVHRDGGNPVSVLIRDRAMALNAILWMAGLGSTVAAAQSLPLITSN